MVAPIRAPREEVLRLYGEGLLDREIADELGVEVGTIGRVRRGLGLPGRSTARTIPEDELAAQRRLLEEERMSYAEVARTLGVDEQTLAKNHPGFQWSDAERGEYLATLRLWDAVDAANYATRTRDYSRAPRSFNFRTSGERLAA